jgi:hypothetical protein
VLIFNAFLWGVAVAFLVHFIFRSRN